jgi:hypothetical protein
MLYTIIGVLLVLWLLGFSMRAHDRFRLEAGVKSTVISTLPSPLRGPARGEEISRL